MTEIVSTEESVILHRKDGQICAMVYFNGQATMYTIGEPMGRKEMNDFYETQNYGRTDTK